MKLSEVLALKPHGIGWIRLILIPLLTGLVFAGLAAYVTMSREVQPETPLSQVISETQSSWLQMGFLVLAVLMAPFVEEIIFRGYIFYVIRRVAGGWAAFVIVALIFGLMHFQQYWGDWLVIALITGLGFMLTFFRLTWGTSIPGIIMHYTFNFTMTLVPVISLFLADPFYARYQTFYQQLTDPQKEELLLKSLQKNPAHAPSNNDLAWLYAQQGRYLDEALKMADTALESAPEEFAFLDTKAEVLYRMGRLEEAIAIEAALAEKYPDNSYIAGQLQKFHEELSGEGPP
jgi:membrane protease YdiL (CAAX protease family)